MRQNDTTRLKRREIFVVERDLLTRAAIAHWVNRFEDLHVCGEAASGVHAARAIAALHPDLVLTEIVRKQDLGFIHNLHQAHPRLPILVFFIPNEARYASRVLEVGACGYLAKGVDGPRLIAGIRSVLNRRRRKRGRHLACESAPPPDRFRHAE